MSQLLPPLTITLIRHATLLVEIGGKRLLVDPMLSKQGVMDSVQPAVDPRRFPLVDLPLGEAELDRLLADVDAVLVTHTHRDHWDEAARERLASDQRLFCQPAALADIQAQGFLNAQAIPDVQEWDGLRLTRTGGQHGTGEVGQKMGPVSGFVLAYADQSVYIAGDTIWCPEVAAALSRHQPRIVVLNTGGAQFTYGDPITMTGEDVELVLGDAPWATAIAVHLDTVNHCALTRPLLKDFLRNHHLADRCLVPDDGQTIVF